VTETTRRSQQERRSATRTRVLDAAVACLLEQGYAGFSIGEVQKRADMARGTLLHHFPAKADLVSAAVGHLVTQRVERAQQAATGATADRLDAFVDAVWADLSSPEFHALLELWGAARTDLTLREALAREQPHLLGRIQSGLEAVLSDGRDDDPRVPLLVAFTVQLLTGLSITGVLGARDAELARTREAWKRALRVLLGDLDPHDLTTPWRKARP
jgi:AcrR family transcriptional regulator